MNRRRFLLSALAAPAVITTAGLLMPVRVPLWTPPPVDAAIAFIVTGHIVIYDSRGEAYRIPVCV